MEEEGNSDRVATGELVMYELFYQFISPTTLNQGDALIPAKLEATVGRRYADLHLVADDLTHCLKCFSMARSEDVDTVSSASFRAFVHSGIIAYGRCVKQGVRTVSLETLIPPVYESYDSHDLLITLRDKHIAHSVNGMEYADPVGIMIQRAGGLVEPGEMIGSIKKYSVGVSKKQLADLSVHVSTMLELVQLEINKLGTEIHQQFLEQLKRRNGVWEVAPIAKNLDETKVERRRKSS